MKESTVTLLPEDIAAARLRGADLSALEKRLLDRLNLPLPEATACLDFFIDRFMQKGAVSAKQQKRAPRRDPELIFVPFSTQMLKSNDFLPSLINKTKPSAILVDSSIQEAGAALFYAFSLEYALNLTTRVLFSSKTARDKETVFSAEDFLPELVFLCHQKEMALFPIGSHPRAIVSEHQYTYNKMMESAHLNFSDSIRQINAPESFSTAAEKHLSTVFSAGFDFMTARENLISASCYAASRLYDIVKGSTLDGRLLVFYRFEHALDFPGIVNSMFSDKTVAQEFYVSDDPVEPGEYKKAPVAVSGAASSLSKGLHAKLHNALAEMITDRMDETLSLDEVDTLSSRLLETLRRNAYIEKPSGVRGTLALKEIAQGYGLIQGSLTRRCLAKAAWIALAHRTRMKQSTDSTLESVIKNSVCRVIYGIALLADHLELKKDKRRPLTPEEIARALQGLSEATLKRLNPQEGFPLEDQAFASEAMNHPLVQQALKEHVDSGLFEDSHEAYQDLLNELEEREYLQLSDASHMTPTRKGHNELKERINKASAQGEIDPETAKEALRNSKAMSAPSETQGRKLFGSPEAESEFMAELMDYQHQVKSEGASLENLYVHYALNKNKEKQAFKEADDYESLKIMLHGLEKQGALRFGTSRKNFFLTHRLLTRLLEELIQRRDTRLLEKRAFRREHETDKTEVRRYQKGDAFRDISIRHTLRRILRKAKPMEEINYSDIRSFEKKPLDQLDIVICVDVSASMKENGKLRYAKMAIAELARAAIAKKDRIGIVAFSNLGHNVMPLTDKLTPVLETAMSLRPDQYTNMGNGLRSARNMLLKDKRGNQKYIVLITDGEPNAALSDDAKGAEYHKHVAAFSKGTTMDQKKALGAHHALIEAAKTARQHIKISVVYICPDEKEDNESEKTARGIARIGNGRFHRVKSIQHLPSEALETVG